MIVYTHRLPCHSDRDLRQLSGGIYHGRNQKSTGAAFCPSDYFAAYPTLDPDTPLDEFRVE